MAKLRLDSRAYIADCRLKAWRRVAELTNAPSEGLAQAARAARKAGAIGNTTCKNLVLLESAFHFSKHVSAANTVVHLGKLEADISSCSSGSDSTVELSRKVVPVLGMHRSPLAAAPAPQETRSRTAGPSEFDPDVLDALVRHGVLAAARNLQSLTYWTHSSR